MATGLIDYGIVKPELAGAFGAGVRAQQDERMQNQLAQQKLAMGQMQQEQAGLQLQDFKRRQSALDQFVAKAQQTGRTGTPKELAQQFYDYAITAKEPQVIMAAQQALLAADEREKYLSERSGGAAPAMPTGTPVMSRPTGQAGLEMGEAERIAQGKQGLAEQDARYAQMEREGEANRQDATYRLATGGDPVAEAQYRLATGYEPSNVPAPAFGGAPALRRPSGQAELAAMEDAERAKQRVNALAPTPAPSVNALAPSANAMAPDAATALQNKIIDLQTRFPNSSKQEVALLTKRLEAMLKESPDLINMERLGYPLTQEGYKQYRDAQRQDRLLSPEEEAQKLRIAAAGRAPGTTVTMVSEKAEQGARGKMLVDQYGDISKAATLATKTLPSIEANLSALNKGFDTGFGKETVAAGASVLAALGVKDAEKFATDSQKFQSNAITGILQKQLEQKGPQTESDARRIEQIGAQLGKTKNANEFILATAKEQLKRDVEQRNFYDRWYRTNKTYDGAEDAWFNGEGGKSLFDRPNLKKYGVSAATTETPAATNRPSLDSIFKPKRP